MPEPPDDMLSHFAHVSHCVMQPCSPCTLISATDAVPYLHRIQYRIWTADSSGCRRTCTSACLQTLSQACMPVFGHASAQFTLWQRYPTAVQPHICMSWQAYPRIYDATLRASAVLQKLCKGGVTTLDMANLSSRTTAGQCAYFCISQAIITLAATSALHTLRASL